MFLSRVHNVFDEGQIYKNAPFTFWDIIIIMEKIVSTDYGLFLDLGTSWWNISRNLHGYGHSDPVILYAPGGCTTSTN